MIRRFALPTVLLLALFSAPAGADDPVELEEIKIYFELNETDGDAEVVMFAKASEGMERLYVLDPSGERRVYLKSSGKDDIGQGEILIESAEPSIEGVKKAFPEGRYLFVARTVSGQHVSGRARLSHRLLPAPSFTPADEEGVDPDHAVVSWTPVPGAAGYQVEIEQDDLGQNLTVTVGPDISSLEIPQGFLRPGTEYEIGVATLSPSGNVAVAESSFTTAD